MHKQWYEIYRIITNLLVKFYEECKNKNLDPGQELYRLCTQKEYKQEFFEINPWIKKFEDVWKVSSIDPLHIFASFNNWKISAHTRRRKLDFFYRVLNVNKHFYELELSTDTEMDVFKQFPHIQITRTVSARNESEQLGIWNFFYKVCTGSDELEAFDELLEYYGVAFSSLSIFLFWIRSDVFIPLDKNTTSFLLNLNKKCIPIKNYVTYKKLLAPHMNKSGNLYRNLAYISIDPQKNSLILEEKGLNEELQEVLQYIHYIKEGESKKPDKMEQEVLVSPYSINEFKKEELRRFSIFAIKPLKGCSEKYRKALEENTIYYLNHTYEIKEDDTIIYNADNDFDLYSKNEFLSININAVVGKNGTGKSSLMELLLLTINNLTFNIDPSKFKDLERVDDALEVDLYVALGKLYRITYSNNSVAVYVYKSEDGEVYLNAKQDNAFDLQDFFYTIYTNYSIYSLNASKEGFSWLQKLFHKNDAYQTPVVIEPKRTKGNLDINSIEFLGKNRLLYRMLLPFDEEEEKRGFKLVTETKGLESVRFVLNDAKINKIREKVSKLDKKIVDTIVEHYKLINFNAANELSNLQILCVQYICYKVIDIHQTYEDLYPFNLDCELKEYLQKLDNDTSHITNKLRQTLNFYNFEPKLIQIYLQPQEKPLALHRMSEEIEKFKHHHNLELIHVLPPAFFEPFFFLRDVITHQGEIPFETLSSGEMQSIITINAVLYHVLNLNSTHSNKHDDNLHLAYKNINIVLDEIELYYHPEMQRRFVFNLLEAIRNLDDINEIHELNIILVTHSPFILSDIVSTNALLMGNVSGEDNLPTFASNIHTLLSKSFFMENGLIGKFAKSQINKLIETLNGPKTLNEDDLRTCRYLIPAIGEPIIRKQLQMMYDSKLLENIKQTKVARDEIVDELIEAIGNDSRLKKRLLEALKA